MECSGNSSRPPPPAAAGAPPPRRRRAGRPRAGGHRTPAPLTRQQFGHRAALIHVLAEDRVGLPEQVALVADGVQQGGVQVADVLVVLGAVAGQFQVAAGLDAPAEVAQQDHRPLPAAAVVALGGVGQVHDQGVVPHRAVALLDGLELADQAGDQFEVEYPDRGGQFVPGLALEPAAVADSVLADADAQAAELHAEVRVAGPAGERDHVGEPGGQGGGGEVELGVEPIGLDVALVLVGDGRGVAAEDGLQLHQPAVARPHVLEGVQIGLQLFAFGAGQGGLGALHVGDHVVEQALLGVEGLAGVAAGDRAEQGLIRQVGPALGGQGLAPARGRAVVDDGVLGSVGDAQPDVREDIVEPPAEGVVDGFGDDASAVADPAAGVVGPQGAEVVGVSAGVHLARQALDHRQAVLVCRHRLQRGRQFQPGQRLVGHPGADLAALAVGVAAAGDQLAVAGDALGLDLVPGQAVALDHEHEPPGRRAVAGGPGSRGLRLQLADHGGQQEAAGPERHALDQLTP